MVYKETYMELKILDAFGFPNYAVTDNGYVWSIRNQKWLRLRTNPGGYKHVSICGKTIGVHRLVAMAFVPNPENKPEVNHKDCNPANNTVDNLEWVTKRENLEYQYKLGSLANLMSEDDVHFICQKLADGYSCTNIARKYNFPYTAVYQIKRGENWKHISSKYNFNKPRKRNLILTKSQVNFVCQELLKNKSVSEIAKENNFSRDVIQKIKSKKNWKSVSSKYF